MKSFLIKKAPLGKSFTGINSEVLGVATGELKFCGLKLFLYLSTHIPNEFWTVNPSVFAKWLGSDYSKDSEARLVRKIINDGLIDLIDKGYIKQLESVDTYEFLDQKIPKT